MARENLVVRSANKIVAKFDNKTIGLLQDVRFQEDYQPTEASGIGNINVQEYVPTIARYTVQTRYMVMNVGSMLSAGVVPQDSDAVLQGLVFDIEIIDKQTGKTLRKYTGCSYASGDVEVTKHQIVVSNASFNCLQATGSLT